MTDTGIRYTHCRGPHCGGQKLRLVDEQLDGLCFGLPADSSCFSRARQWAQAREMGFMALDSPEWSIAIDQWLEAGAP